MKEKGFDPAFAAALCAAAAALGPIFPPSIPLIIYGSVAQVSGFHLLMAGVLPALLTALLLGLTTAYLAIQRGYPRATRWPTPGEVVRAVFAALPAVLAPVLLMGGMITGFFSPTEAAAVTALYVLLVNAFVYRDFSVRHLAAAAVETVRITGSILFIVTAAALFAWVLAVEEIPQTFGQQMLSITKDPKLLLLIVNVLLLFVGMFMESISALLLLTPLLVPPLKAAGVDPVQIGVVIVFNLMVGLITPPMGMSLFLVSDVSKTPIERILKQLLPFYIPLLIALIAITYYPPLTLLPRQLLR